MSGKINYCNIYLYLVRCYPPNMLFGCFLYCSICPAMYMTSSQKEGHRATVTWLSEALALVFPKCYRSYWAASTKASFSNSEHNFVRRFLRKKIQHMAMFIIRIQEFILNAIIQNACHDTLSCNLNFSLSHLVLIF